MRGSYRYTHCRTLPDGGPYWLWVLLNPLSGDNPQSPQMMNRLAGTTRDGGGGGVYLAHLYAWITGSNSDLFMLPEYQRIGPINDRVLREFATEIRSQSLGGGQIVVAWGDQPKAASRGAAVVRLLRESGPVHCLGKSKSGRPLNPLYAPGSQKLVPF